MLECTGHGRLPYIYIYMSFLNWQYFQVGCTPIEKNKKITNKGMTIQAAAHVSQLGPHRAAEKIKPWC